MPAQPAAPFTSGVATHRELGLLESLQELLSSLLHSLMLSEGRALTWNKPHCEPHYTCAAAVCFTAAWTTLPASGTWAPDANGGAASSFGLPRRPYLFRKFFGASLARKASIWLATTIWVDCRLATHLCLILDLP